MIAPGIEVLPGRAVDTHRRFKHVMALALNPLTSFEDGVIRCITEREGRVDVSGFVDHSELYKVHKCGEYQYEITEKLHIADEDKVIGPLLPEGFEFLGLEDPDLIVDKKGLLHLYCTVPLINRASGESRIYLGHAEGESLDSLVMQDPVLKNPETSAKEVSLVPAASDGIYRHLIESSSPGTEFTAYSTVRVAKAKDFYTPWEYGDTIFHPAERNLSWAGGHASPGPFLPQSFISVGEHSLVGFMNGREHDRVKDEQVVFGRFSVGLCIYDYEHGELSWVSETPVIEDEDAKTITFSSQFVQTGDDSGILYAHIDDSFVRAYRITAQGLKGLLP